MNDYTRASQNIILAPGCEGRFAFWLNAVKINVYNKKLFRIQFHTTSPWAHTSISHRSGAMGLETLVCFKYYIAPK